MQQHDYYIDIDALYDLYLENKQVMDICDFADMMGDIEGLTDLMSADYIRYNLIDYTPHSFLGLLLKYFEIKNKVKTWDIDNYSIILKITEDAVSSDFDEFRDAISDGGYELILEE